MKPTFFATPVELRRWFERHHGSAAELWVGFHKRGSGMPSITWPESVDVALCFGWIDGVRKSLDETSYVIRFTPRRPTSIWSAVNTRRFVALRRAGRVRPAGLAAFQKRREERSGVYSFEQRKSVTLAPAYAAELRKKPAAWKFYAAQPPWYRRTSAWWVMSAKQEETRRRRLRTLIEDSAAGRTIAPLTRKPPGRTNRRGASAASKRGTK